MNKLLHNNQVDMYVLGVQRHIGILEIRFPGPIVSTIVSGA